MNRRYGWLTMAMLSGAFGLLGGCELNKTTTVGTTTETPAAPEATTAQTPAPANTSTNLDYSNPANFWDDPGALWTFSRDGMCLSVTGEHGGNGLCDVQELPVDSLPPGRVVLMYDPNNLWQQCDQPANHVLFAAYSQYPNGKP